MDFVTLAKALGGQKGEVVRLPDKVEAAVRRGVKYVLKNSQSYILDMRTAPDTPTPPPSPTKAMAQMMARYVSQPPLDIFHRTAAKRLRASGTADPTPNVPVIF